MSKNDFSPQEFADRHCRVREKMEVEGIDLLLVIHPTSIQYLIGVRTNSYEEFQVLLFPRKQRPLTMLTRFAEVSEVEEESLAEEVIGWGGGQSEDPIEVLARILRDKGDLVRRIGLELLPGFYLHAMVYKRLKSILEKAFVKDASFLIHDLRLVKSPAEIAYIREAARIADAAMRTAVDVIAEGVTEMAVTVEVYRTLLRMGSDILASPMNFATRERFCYGHGAPTPLQFRCGDFMNIEYSTAVKNYCATIGRQFCLGEPTPRMRDLYHAVREAGDACIAEIRAGVSAVKPHLAAEKVIENSGLDRYQLHTRGYGIAPGYPPAWGKNINFIGDSTYTLRAGMVLSVEPPVFIHEERLGARVIDNVLVIDGGAEILSTFTRDLIVVNP